MGIAPAEAGAKDLMVIVRLLRLLSPNQPVPLRCRRGEAQRAGVHALDRRTEARAPAPRRSPASSLLTAPVIAWVGPGAHG
jgi:hypothetical protein